MYELNVHRIKEYSFNEFVRKMKTVCGVTVKNDPKGTFIRPEALYTWFHFSPDG